MAWEEFEYGEVRGISGDLPLDKMTDAVRRINREYLERFGRRPYFQSRYYISDGLDLERHGFRCGGAFWQRCYAT